MSDTNITTTQTPTKSKSIWTEDWLSVFIGGIIVLSFLTLASWETVFEFKLPNYKWERLSDLLSKVFSAVNLFHLAKVGFIVLILATAAIWLQGGNWKKFIFGFSLVYVLGIASLILAGNKTISY